MRILVAVKRVVDYAVKIRVNPQSSSVDLTNTKMSLNPFCEIAVEEAIRLKDQSSNKAKNDIVAVTIGPKACTETLRTALAMGCDRGIHVLTPEEKRTDYTDIQPLTVAQVLEKVIEKEESNVVLVGKQSIDSDCGQVGPMLAGRLGWPQVTFAAKVQPQEDGSGGGGGMLVERETDGGTETLKLHPPKDKGVVISCDLRLNEPRYATLPNIMKAKKKKVETIVVGEMGGGVQVDPRHEVLEVYAPEERKAGVMVGSVDELVDKLRNEAGVIA